MEDAGEMIASINGASSSMDRGARAVANLAEVLAEGGPPAGASAAAVKSKKPVEVIILEDDDEAGGEESPDHVGHANAEFLKNWVLYLSGEARAVWDRKKLSLTQQELVAPKLLKVLHAELTPARLEELKNKKMMSASSVEYNTKNLVDKNYLNYKSMLPTKPMFEGFGRELRVLLF